MNIEQRAKMMKELEEFGKLSGDMEPEGYEWDWILHMSLTKEELPNNLPRFLRTAILTNKYSDDKTKPTGIYYKCTDQDYNYITFGVSNSMVDKEFDSKHDFIESSVAHHFDNLLIRMYNKYKRKAIRELKRKLKELESFPDLKED